MTTQRSDLSGVRTRCSDTADTRALLHVMHGYIYEYVLSSTASKLPGKSKVLLKNTSVLKNLIIQHIKIKIVTFLYNLM
jgi:hypothetical protein